MQYIIGHKNPDTDATCSAIAYQHFLSKKYPERKCQAVTLGKINKETFFVLQKFKINAPEIVPILPENTEVILVDHNEQKQTIDNIEQLNLLEIIDHHKADIKTDKPISILVKPLGSTCSIIAQKFFQNNIPIPKDIAGILLSAIISDTLFFRSPTTTEIDKELVDRLNKIAQINDLEKYSLEMFQAKSDLGDIGIEELIKLDYKEFDFKDGKYGIGVMETTDVNFGLNKKDEILQKLAEIKEREGLRAVYFIVVDILNEVGYALCSDQEAKELFSKLFSVKDKNSVLLVNGLISRKKQIVPAFERM